MDHKEISFQTLFQKSNCPEILIGIFEKYSGFLKCLNTIIFYFISISFFSLKHYNRFIVLDFFYLEKIPVMYIVVMVIAIGVRPLIYIILTIVETYLDVWTRNMSFCVKLYYLLKKKLALLYIIIYIDCKMLLWKEEKNSIIECEHYNILNRTIKYMCIQ